MKLKKLTREEFSWSLYDWSSSAVTLLLTAIIPIYLKSIGHNYNVADSMSTAHWGIVNSVSTLVLALCAPVIGAVADFKGNKNRFFNVFFTVGILSLFASVFLDNYYALLIANFVMLIGYTGTYIIYDAFLVDVSPDERMDYVSSFGFGMGYIGGSIPFVLSLLLIMLEPFGLDGVTAVKLSLALNGVWWLLFTLPFLKNVRQVYSIEKTKHVVSGTLKNVAATFKKIAHHKVMGLFLLSYFFYIDGVNTVITMSTEIGADKGIDANQMVLALLATQLVAAVSVMLCARLVKTTRAKPIILVSIAVFAGVCVFGYFMTTALHFWIMALVVALVLGTIQALSRSFFAKLIPEKDRNNEYFGFYSIMTRYASILGPLILAGLTLWTGSSRYGILGILVLFVAGFIIFARVKEPDEEKEAASCANSADVLG
ncbi:MFS transporter, UMF1 family [Sporobacter termitidis DSM 10068]|uniref:MFS transporter, UMF1 family n=1 Tax=Sporobacter termitidis DSM 10068 TaxID=1123282 RepID=A0A1M5ZAS9_9FIRM|nr:MFS transporter [Sporobacter termitidis]SHI21327.1 MFS transporter, UMF1 family [Sporobacter termitidis DSM 10068]